MTFPTFATGDVLTAADMNAVGMWRVAEQTFSAVTAVNFSSVFTSNYNNYVIVMNLTSSGAIDLWYRERLNTTDATTSYATTRAYYYSNGASVLLQVAENANSTYAGTCFGAFGTGITINVFKPNTTDYTTIAVESTTTQNVSPYCFANRSSGAHYVATAYNGFSILTLSATTITGKATVYGRRLA